MSIRNDATHYNGLRDRMDDDDHRNDDLWNAALERLEGEYARPIVNMWLEPIRLVELGRSEIVLSVHSYFARDWVEARFEDDLAQILWGLLGEAVPLRFIVADEIEAGCVSTARWNSNERLDRIEARLEALEAHAATR